MTISLRTRPASNTALIKRIGLLWLAVLTCWHLGLPLQSIGGAQEIGIIRASNLNMRPEPGTRRPPLMKLQPGSRVTILEHTGLWLKISYNGQTGYVRNKPHYIKIESHQEIGADPPAASKHRPDQATPKKIDHLKHTAAEISDEIEKSEVRVLNIKKEERAVVSQLNDIDLRLDGYGRRLRKLKSDQRVLDQRIAKKRKAV